MTFTFTRAHVLKAPLLRQYNAKPFGTTAAAHGAVSAVAVRQHRSRFWIPQATLKQQNEGAPDAGLLLVRAGYLRQAYSGIFHMLPLGLRVQSKIEALVDKHMQSLGASKVSLSSISSHKLWEQTGRLNKGSEFFKFKDRKQADWLLAPTHEEEITALVKDLVHAPGHLPVRLYQVSRKYRDEKRPRGGLLRGREFIMKDLYTFDSTEVDAHATYADVRQAYSNLFDELKLPYIEARADSGNMGGNLSHEFHFPSNLGEDDIITCTTCDYAKNEEFVPKFRTARQEVMLNTPDATETGVTPSSNLVSHSFLSKDRRSLVRAYACTGDSSSNLASINAFAVKECFDGQVEVDTGVEDPEALFKARLTSGEDQRHLHVYYVFDQLMKRDMVESLVRKDAEWLQANQLKSSVLKIEDDSTSQSILLKKQTGDACPQCEAQGQSGKLEVTKAIEVGHTFHLGDRYSSKLDLLVPGTGQKEPSTKGAYVSMGCHGIGVSRLIAAVASALSDAKGLIWPRAVAPFEVLIVVNKKHKDLSETVEVGNQIYDDLAGHKSNPADVLIDDREDVDYGWKLKDADLIGYPVVVVIGKGWAKKKLVEIQCRRLNVKEEVSLTEAPDKVRQLLLRL